MNNYKSLKLTLWQSSNLVIVFRESGNRFLRSCMHGSNTVSTYKGSSRRFATKKESKRLRKTVQSVPQSDVYGPPDPVSNIQTVRFYIPPDETPTEKDFRLRRTEVLEWNHKFWANHNNKFFKEKAEFVKTLKPAGKISQKKTTPAEQMAVFYRTFLNENREEHGRYNREWYKKNISLLWPAFLVFWIRLRRRIFSKKEA